MEAHWTTFVPSPRDHLITRAGLGRITPEQAEAVSNGLEPFAQQPKMPAFNPLEKSYWSLSMTIAWIAWRDLSLVRAQDAEFRSHCKQWVPRRWKRLLK